MKLLGYEITKAAKQENRLLANMIWKWLYGREWAKESDETSLLNAYRSWVYVCVSKNANSVASIPFKLYVAKGANEKRFNVATRKIKSPIQDRLFKRFSYNPVVNKAVEVEEVLEHESIDLVNNVNTYMNKSDMFELTQIHLDLVGNAYWYIKKDKAFGVPVEIWPIIPNRMTIVPDKEDFIKGYIYTTGAEKTDFEPDEIIHFKCSNPRDLYYGMSPLQAVADVYNINQNMNTYENALFSNNARPEGFFKTAMELDAMTTERLQSELLETWSGIRNSGKTGLLTHDITFQPMNLSPRDLGFLQGRTWTKTEIFNAFDVPTGLLDQNANRANAEAAQYTYMKFGIEPRIHRIEEKLNEKLLPMYDERLFIAFEGVVPEDREFELREDQTLFNIGAKSTNEIRADRGMDEYEGGDTLYAPFGLAPIGTTTGEGLEPIEEPEPEEQEVEEMITLISEKVARNLAGSFK